MNVSDQIRSAWHKVRAGGQEPVRVEAGAEDGKRKTAALPALLGPYRPSADLMPKATPANLRRFAETPVPRRAINSIKDRVAGLDWQIRLKRGVTPTGALLQQAGVLRSNLEAPNGADSFRSLIEQVLEDALVGGFGAIEMEATGDEARPFELWPVDGATIKINPQWDGSAEMARYGQGTGKVGPAAVVQLRDDQLIYLRMNPRTHTPFGLGPLEVAFETVNAFLTAHRYAGKLASNSVVQYAMWINEATPTQHERLIRWWQDEVEGTGRVPILSCTEKPEILRFGQGNDADLRLEWQQFLIRMIANAFGLPPMMLGMEQEVNRSTAAEMADEAFRYAIAPTAKLVAEHLTRDLFAKKLGLRESEFVYNDLEARNEVEEVQIQTMLLTAGVLTVDEVRAMRGLGPKLEQPAGQAGR